MDLSKLFDELSNDEGREASAYTDSLGYLTIGVGHLIDKRKGGTLSDWIIDQILRDDIMIKASELDVKLPWWRTLDDDRQNVIVNMAFNLGVDGLLEFHHFLAALQAGDYESASRYMLESLWATQVGARADRLAARIKGIPQ